MRNVLISSIVLVIAAGFLVACNSKEQLTSQLPTAPASATPQPQQKPTDNARRITAQELHRLWEAGKVLMVDTRTEPAFKTGHIRGAILIPSNEFAARADELPRNRMIVTYCT